jgi:hypothetical protein
MTHGKMTNDQRSKYFAKKAADAIKLLQSGKSASEAAQILRVAPSFITRHTKGIIPRKKWGYSGKRQRVYNHWLDPNDEANVHQFWVPSPEEIAAECKKIRNGDLYIRSASGGKHETSHVSVASRTVSVDIFTRKKTAKPFNQHGNRKRKIASDRGPLSYRNRELLRPSDSIAAQKRIDRAEREQNQNTSA